jgi:hypothetical protein
MTVPTPGRIVLYTLSKQDADATNKRRADAQGHMQDHRETSNGVQIHVGNQVAEGDVYPMIIIRVWSANNPTAAVNGQVFLDGNDLLWASSVQVGTGPRTFAWPVRSQG